MDLASSTVIVPSTLPLSMASAMMLPMAVSQLTNGRDLGHFLAVLHGGADFFRLGHDGFGRLEDTALKGGWIGTSGHVAETFGVDGFSQDVAVVVPSPAMSEVLETSLMSWAPMFS